MLPELCVGAAGGAEGGHTGNAVGKLEGSPNPLGKAVGMVEELRRGVPSYVTDDVADTDIEFSHDELRERMSGNLCRCGAYNGIVDAITDVYGEHGT